MKGLMRLLIRKKQLNFFCLSVPSQVQIHLHFFQNGLVDTTGPFHFSYVKK